MVKGFINSIPEDEEGTPKEMELLRLKFCRKARESDFCRFVESNNLQTMLGKFLGFLTDSSSQNLLLRVTTGDESYTDGKTITLGMPDNFFSTEYDIADWAAMFKVLEAHEAQHVNSSNISDMELLGKEYAAMMEAKAGLPAEFTAKLAHTYLNIMEDSRIENIIIHKMPGFRLAFQLINNEIRRLCGPDEQARNPGQEYTDFQNNALSYAKTGRLAPNMRVYVGTRFEAEFKKVAHWFDEAVDAHTSADCREICKKMLWDTADYFAELLKQEATREKVEQSMTGGNEYASNGEHEYNSPNMPDPHAESGSGEGEGSGKPDGKDAGKPGDGKGDKPGDSSGDGKLGDGKGGKSGDGKSGDGKDGKSGDKSGDSASGGKGSKAGQNSLRLIPKEQRLSADEDWTDDFSDSGPEGYILQNVSPEDLARIRRGVRDELASAEKKPKEKKDKTKEVEELYDGERARTFAESFPPVPDLPVPPELVSSASKLERKFREILRTKRTEKRFMRTGNLCSKDLYRVGTKDPHIFHRKGKPMDADMAVEILLDNSGSMAANGATASYDGGRVAFSKSNLSRYAAAVIELALKKYAAIKITLFDVSCGTIRHATLKKFEEKTKYSKCYNSINVVGVGGGNKDGFSIRVAAKDLLSRREHRKVLVVLSDGLPSDYNGGERAGMQDVRDAVREARRKGVIVIPIMFGDAGFRKAKKDCFDFMYDKYISSEPADVSSQFEKLFISLLKQA